MNEGKARLTADRPSSKRKDTSSIAVTLRFDIEPEEKIDTVLDFEKDEEYNIIKHDHMGLYIDTDFSVDNAQGLLEKYEQLISRFVSQRNDAIQRGNAQLKTEIRCIITESKAKLKAQNDTFGKLSQIIPLSIKQNPSSPVIPLSKKKQIIINPPPARATRPPKIEQKILEAIIDMLFKGGRTFETNPETFAKLEEEELRNVLLSFLNGNFELRAVGEAFNKIGKADISLVYSGNNLFIAECKYWAGAELYAKTIDQLFKYLTWRENIGVLIWFVCEKDFTSIVNKAVDATNSHSSVVPSSIIRKSDSYFTSKHIFPEDKDKTVEIHHLLFTLYSSRMNRKAG